MELDDEIHLKPTENKGAGPRVWAGEVVVVEDEEKALPPISQDAITDVSRRHEFYSGR